MAKSESTCGTEAAGTRPGDGKATVTRKTKETDITVELNLDGRGRIELDTGIPFLNHMLEIFARHGFFDLSVRARGDLDVDQHHTVEDVGLALGQAWREALGTKAGIRRFGDATCPLDEALVSTVVDLSGRPFLAYNLRIKQARVGDFDTELVHDFMVAFTNAVGMNLHLNQVQGRNPHHIIEAGFKALARALDQRRQQIDPRGPRRGCCRRRARCERGQVGGGPDLRSHFIDAQLHRHHRLRHGQSAQRAEGLREGRASAAEVTSDAAAHRGGRRRGVAGRRRLRARASPNLRAYGLVKPVLQAHRLAASRFSASASGCNCCST